MTNRRIEALDRMARTFGLLPSEAAALFRAERTLRRWAEQECGDGNDYASWSIERDEETGVPYRCIYPHTGKMYRTRIADRERGALARVAKLCAAHGLNFYHQTDPRGCALYVAREPLNATNYTRGVAACEG